MNQNLTSAQETYSSQEAEAVVGFALNQALKRIRLEKVAERSSASWYGRTFCLVVCMGLVFFEDYTVKYLWFFILVILIQIESSSAKIHSRIDAILELEKLDSAKDQPT